jgi:hypothetical protein
MEGESAESQTDEAVIIRISTMSSSESELVVVKAAKKRTRKLATIPEDKVLRAVKPKRTRAVAPVPEPIRTIEVHDHDQKETFDIPATFSCSSCHVSHSIAEHLEIAGSTSKIYQTCRDCRDKGVQFYRRHLVKAGVTAVDSNGDAGQDSAAVRGEVCNTTSVEAEA